MATYRFRTPDQTIDLGEFDSAQEALEAAVGRHHSDNHRGSGPTDSTPTNGTLEVLVGQDWHSVDIEGDMP